MIEKLPTKALFSDVIPSDHIRYRTLFIAPKRDFGGQAYLIKGRSVMSGFIVTDGSCNVMPGATWFETVDEAKHAIDVLLAVKGDSDMFWEIMQPFRYTPGDKSDCGMAVDSNVSCGKHYAIFKAGVCVEVGTKETA